MGEQINGNRTMTINDVIKLVVFVVTLCGYGYAQQLRSEKLELRIAALEKAVTDQGKKQSEDIEAWKKVTVDMIFQQRHRP